MRKFYKDEAPIDTLLQISKSPVWDGDLVSKPARDKFHSSGWIDRCQGFNIITPDGRKAIDLLSLTRG